MIADSIDIHFECSQCGQHLVVEAAGAGLTANCPICNTIVTVPRPAMAARVDDRGAPEARGRTGVSTAAGPDAGRPAYADPVPDELREELIDASLINGKLVRDLQKAREEVTRLQQQLKAVSEECERLNTSTTHTHAELKTFQTERQQFKIELSGLRQKWAAAEEALAVREAEVKEARARLTASVPAAEFKAVEAKLIEVRRVVGEWESKAVAAQKAHEEARRNGEKWKSKSEATEAALADAKKLAALRASEAKASEAALKKAQKLTAKSETKVADLDRSLAAERAHREKLAGEIEAKRRELGEAQTRFALLEDELHKTRGQLGKLESELAGAKADSLRLTGERGDLERQLHEAAAALAEAGDLKALLSRSGLEQEAQAGKLRLAEEANQALTERCEQLRRESESLRRDVSDSHAGRELLELRSRLDEATVERDRVTARLNAVEADLRAFTAREKSTRAELEHARSERDDAIERVESLRETRAAKDNQVLRGIIARLNSDLAQRATEVLRLKRARYAFKIACVLFGIGILAVIVFAIVVLPHALRQ
ncbi:MAG: hypothetical protein WCF18_07080 [Chthoniobacteraceae bacterium]